MIISSGDLMKKDVIRDFLDPSGDRKSAQITSFDEVAARFLVSKLDLASTNNKIKL